MPGTLFPSGWFLFQHLPQAQILQPTETDRGIEEARVPNPHHSRRNV
jgi:hypothetical protein